MADTNKIVIDNTEYGIEDSVSRTKINNFAVTENSNWTRSSSYPSGASIPTGTWVTISQITLDAGVWFLQAGVNLSSSTAASKLQRLQVGNGSSARIVDSNSVTSTQRLIPSTGIVKLSQQTTIYLQVYTDTSGMTAIADAGIATRLF